MIRARSPTKEIMKKPRMMKCPVCGKIFEFTGTWRYKDYRWTYCSYTCQREQEKRVKESNEEKRGSRIKRYYEYKGQRYTLGELAKELGINYTVIMQREKNGLDIVTGKRLFEWRGKDD